MSYVTSLFKSTDISRYEKMFDADEKQNKAVERKIKETSSFKFTEACPESMQPGFVFRIKFSTIVEAKEQIQNIASVLGMVYAKYLKERQPETDGITYFAEPSAFAKAKNIKKFTEGFEKLIIDTFAKRMSKEDNVDFNINTELAHSTFCELMKKCVKKVEIFRYFPEGVILNINCNQTKKELMVRWYKL